ncbi:MAG: hypothetical protein DRO14_05725 [Thermoprotei archaeon]|nr:MAG: hypothetical protein DRO14_05725 [Thermoprotei archaeon]
MSIVKSKRSKKGAKKYVVLIRNEHGVSVKKYPDKVEPAERRSSVSASEEIVLPYLTGILGYYSSVKPSFLIKDYTRTSKLRGIRIPKLVLSFSKGFKVRLRHGTDKDLGFRHRTFLKFVKLHEVFSDQKVQMPRPLVDTYIRSVNTVPLPFNIVPLRIKFSKSKVVRAKGLLKEVSLDRGKELKLFLPSLNELIRSAEAAVRLKDRLISTLAAATGRRVWLDIFEKLFGHKLGRLTAIIDERPKVVVAVRPKDRRYDYVLFLVKVLRDIYRSVIGGIASARYLGSESELSEWLSVVEAGRRIVVLDIDKDRFNKNRSEVLDRLREFSSMDMEFLVLYVEEELKKEIEEFIKSIFGATNPDVIEVRVNEDLPLESYRRLIALYSGFPTREEFDESSTLSSLAMQLEAEYFNILSRVLEDIDITLKLEPSPEIEGNENRESLHHMLLKAVAARHLKSLGVAIDDIEFEYAVSCGDGKVVLDVYDKRGRRAVEVESLYGIGIPEVKVRRTIERLVTCLEGSVSEIWVVIPNNYLLLYGARIYRLVKALKLQLALKGSHLEIKVYGLDVSKQQLLPIEELMNILEDVLSI